MRKRLVALFVLTSLLAACVPDTPPSPGPVVQTGAPLYQLQFQGLNDASSAPQVQAQALRGTLASQALQDAPSALSMDPRPVTTGSFITTVNGVSTRHIQATFRLTNTSAQPLRNLVFAPVVTTDTDGDPSNNAQTPTVAGTPFRAVQYFDGSDASSQASTLVLTQGKIQNMTTGGADLDQAADPYLNPLSTSGLTPAPPAGLSAAVQSSGWLAATTLAAGESTLVTFGVDLQGITPQSARTQPYAFSLLVTAGEDASASTLGSAVDPTRIQGTLPGWTFGQKVLAVSDYTITPLGPIQASGAVDVALPTPPANALQPLLQNCTFQGQSSAPNTRVTGLDNLVAASAQNDLLGSVDEVVTGQPTLQVLRLFSDSAATFNGTATCGPSSGLDLNITLKQGWNVISLKGTTQGTRRIMQLGNIAPGTATALTFTTATERLDVIITDPYSSITVKAGESFQKTVNFSQTGGISGDITLETDVPGITVTPATLTLPSLTGVTGQALQAQALNTTLTFQAAASAAEQFGPLNLIIKKGGVEVGRGRLDFVRVIRPVVEAYVSSSYGAPSGLTRGTSQNVTINLISQNGFAGPVTVTLGNLPDGVTATSANATLSAGQTTQVTVQVTASANAALGTYSATISGENLRAGSSMGFGEGVWRFTVAPAQTPLNLSSASRTAPASQGIWIVGRTQSTYNGSGYTYSTPLIRMVGNQEVQRETLTGSDSPTLLQVGNGTIGFLQSVVQNSTITGNELIRIREDGSRSSQIFATSDLGSVTSGGALDAQGHFWFIKGSSGNVNLMKADATTGAITQVASNQPFSRWSSIIPSPDGQTLLIASNGQSYRVSTSDGSVTLASSSVSAQQIDTAGNLYALSNGQLLRVSPSGTTQTFGQNIWSGTLLGVDRTDPNVVWIQDGLRFAKINTSTSTLTWQDAVVNTSSSFASSAGAGLNGNGGVWGFYSRSISSDSQLFGVYLP